MKKYFTLICSTLLLSFDGFSQAVGTDIFLQGDFVEVGIATNGAYGSGGNAPTGYHPRPDLSLTSGPIGFVADPAKDGWGVGSPGFPDYFGDYFLPGTPQEGWDIAVNGARGLAWRGSGPGSFTGGLTGANTSYTATPTQLTGVWDGSFGNLTIKQTTTQKKDKLYFVTRVELKNTGATTLTNIYYNRSLDPEPDATVGGNYSSDKRIIFQPNPFSRNCLVAATGQDYPAAYVALGTKDCRALCYITNTYTPDAALNNVYAKNGSASGYLYNLGSFSSANTSMGVVFNVGSLAPGESTELAYTYILKQADLDSALSETAPSFLSESVDYKPYTTFRVCPGKTFPLKIKGGSAYKWTWTPGTGLDADSLISSGSLPPDGGAFGDSVSITVTGPRTYHVTGTSLCDTQNLIFYVDTINFSVPPYAPTPVKYCQGATAAALTASGASGAIVLWSTAIGGPETTTAPTPSTAAAGTVRYYVRQQNTAGCFSQYAYVDVITIAKPEPPVVRDTTYCFGAKSVPVTAVGTNIQWFDALTGGTKYPAPPTPSTTINTISYYPSQSVDGCVSDRATLTVNISKVTAGFSLSKDSLCGPELLALTNSSTATYGGAAGTFKSQWWLGDGSVSVLDNPTRSYATQGIYAVKLKVYDDYKCADSLTRKVFVAPESQVAFTKSDSVICQGESIDFLGTATPGYYKLTWDFGDGDVKSYDELAVRQAFTTGGNYTVTFTASYTICGEVSTTQPVEITEVPLINIGTDTTICPGNAPIVLQNLMPGKPYRHYLWSTGDTTSSINVHNMGPYWLIVKDRTCAASDSIMITKGCYIDIPNAFVPGDSDPLNAYFLPRSLLSKSVVGFDMKVFNRWGVQVFESHDINGKGWDGRYKGQDEPYGVYVYQIKVSFSNGLSEQYSGNVTLVR